MTDSGVVGEPPEGACEGTRGWFGSASPLSLAESRRVAIRGDGWGGDNPRPRAFSTISLLVSINALALGLSDRAERGRLP